MSSKSGITRKAEDSDTLITAGKGRKITTVGKYNKANPKPKKK